MLFPRRFRTPLRACHQRSDGQNRLRLHYSRHACHAARCPHRTRRAAGSLGFDVHAGFAGADLIEHHDPRPHLSRQEVLARRGGGRQHRRCCSREGGAQKGRRDARSDSLLHRHFAADSPESANLHRSIDGHLLGCSGRSIPRSLHVGTLLERRHEVGRLGLLRLGCRLDRHQHAPGQPHQPD